MRGRKKDRGPLPSRRQAMAMMGSCALYPWLRRPIDVLVQALVDGVIHKAQAATGAPAPRNYIYIALPGGPCRWYWDMPLNPYADAPNAHPMVGTRLGADGKPAYATILVDNNKIPTLASPADFLRMPSLWGANIPTSGGGTVEMWRILANMVMIRGIDMQVDGHALNSNKQIRPLDARPSLTGLVADASSARIPAVGSVGGNSPASVYKSARGVGQVRLSSTKISDPLSVILGPFNRRGGEVSSAYLGRRQAMEGVIQAALTSLSAYASSQNPGSQELFAMRHEAQNLITIGVAEVVAGFAVLKDKYMKLVSASSRVMDPAMQIPGLTDRVVPGPAGSGADALGPFQSGTDGNFVRNADLRTAVHHSDGGAYPGAQIEELAGGFAIAEILLKNGYSSSVLWAQGSVDNLRFDGASDTEYGFDPHFGGVYPDMVVMAFFYRALAACLYEFSLSLGPALFKETVVHISSEYSRTPEDTGHGTQHGPRTNCCSIFSGAITKPFVVGNVFEAWKDGFYTKIDANWGVAAPTSIDGANQVLGIGHSTSSVAELLRVARPVTNASSLVRESSGGVVPAVELAKTGGQGERS